MALFGPKTSGVVLVDIGSASVGGAWLYVRGTDAPIICYSVRENIEQRENETIEAAMVRTLETVCAQLVRDGSAAFSREAGNTRIHLVLASVAAPWQETKIHTVTIDEEHSFIFTRRVMDRAIMRKPVNSDRVVSDRSVIATKLNGYVTDNPWGKRVHRADLTVLTSTLDAYVARAVNTALRKNFHTHTIELVAFAPVAYAVLSSLYPLQKDYMLIDVSGSATDVLLVKHGVLASVHTHPQGIHDLLAAGRSAARTTVHGPGARGDRDAAFASRVTQAESLWLAQLKEFLATIASSHPLPQALFLLADTDVREFLKHHIETSALCTLWLSEDPLSVVPLAPEHTARVVRVRGLAQGDVFLSLLALFYAERLQRE